MNNEATAAFLAAIDAKTKDAVLNNIATNYGISPSEAFAEVTDNVAEHLLDYLTEPVRTATKVLMARHGTVVAYGFTASATAVLSTNH
jgi:hypothetical protein